MKTTLRAAVVLGLLAVLVGPARTAEDKKPTDVAALESVLFANLKETINKGVDLYNGGDIPGCYRLFEGTLLTVRPLVKHRPKLQDVIDDRLAAAEKEPVMWRKAFALRAALDKVRSEIKPKDALDPDGKVPPIPDDEKKFLPAKKSGTPDDKKPVVPDDKKPTPPDDKKPVVPDDKKPVVPEVKKPDDKKPVPPDDKKKTEADKKKEDDELKKKLEKLEEEELKKKLEEEEKKREEEARKKKADEEARKKKEEEDKKKKEEDDKKKDDKDGPTLLKQPKELVE